MNFAKLSVSEIREYCARRKEAPTRHLLQKLRRDPRQGVQVVYRNLKREFDTARRERRRMERILNFEQARWEAGIERIAGVDEVGVGPLAGPVIAAAVILPPFTRIDGVDDSKKLDRATRIALEAQIRDKAIALSIGVAEVEEIDRINVYQAALQAMRRAVEQLTLEPEEILVDAREIPGVQAHQRSVIGGDGRHFSIAAASIVAKTYRDRLMEQLDRRHPGYGFASHKGYCTPQHQKAIRKLGPSPVHRRSYVFVQELAGEASPEFYELKASLDQESSPAELASVSRRFRYLRHKLSDSECRKFQLLLSRRKSRYPAARQLALL